MAELQYLRSAFAADSGLCDRVLAAAQQSRDQLQLFVDVARFLTRTHTDQQHQTNGVSSEPSSKKRKLDASTGDDTTDLNSATSILDLPDVSFTVPVRKKLSVQLLTSPAGTAAGGGLKITGKDVSYTIPWAAIAQVFCLPVPEKTTRQQNFVVVLDPSTPCQGEAQFVFTLPENPYSGQCAHAADQDTWVTLTGRMMNTYLMELGKGVTLPAEDEFHSAIPQAHRKGEVGYHVKAHVGSKDGYLFFLSSGIVFGFRKPIQVFPFHAIESISYTSVLQRTFNLVITIQPSAEDPSQETKEIEFAMLDQQDFAGIDEYIKRHGLNDASMAKERMAKRIGVNDPKRKKGEDGDQANGVGEDAHADEEEESELQKAERELQDAEDEEEEEDYDPGSEGESEGEGSDSEEEDGGGGEAEDVEEEVDEVEEEE
ncbi:Rtt106-domain-containing protein [Myriangium duriaei CBS 260.36]|uniref:Rtt106-domain-containing protein n=1 Tax=Myriangium duriaei CBS 260.36 TaxID=1168546 RepID=A0A9P4J9R1_9PEZI|nr:Rtt106-domain-containing protein [Myriangium duriaei CBS 260.36]